jgi:hypothetical protein
VADFAAADVAADIDDDDWLESEIVWCWWWRGKEKEDHLNRREVEW